MALTEGGMKEAENILSNAKHFAFKFSFHDLQTTNLQQLSCWRSDFLYPTKAGDNFDVLLFCCIIWSMIKVLEKKLDPLIDPSLVQTSVLCLIR